jgi:tRNA(fMet)-specific endonuclease VapC
MNGSVLDTNVIIKMMHNEIEAIQLLEKIKEKYLPIIVVGELLFGAYNSTKRDANIKAFEELFSQFEILMIDEKTAHSYALIKSELKKKCDTNSRE